MQISSLNGISYGNFFVSEEHLLAVVLVKGIRRFISPYYFVNHNLEHV